MSLPYQPGTRGKETADAYWKKEGIDDNAPWSYRADPALVDAANVALVLGKPLLLTGEPGCGKTCFASSLAWELNLRPPLKFETRSTSTARDLFYRFDTMGMFGAAYKTGENAPDPNPMDYLSFNALGEAVIRAAQPDDTSPLHGLFDHPPELNTLVLIDEVDKAPRDFPNDILNELERMFFKIPELNQAGEEPFKVQAPTRRRPVVVITSNSEKQLPPAFLRRCVYYHVPFPERDKKDRLAEIVASRVGHNFQGPYAPAEKERKSLKQDQALMVNGLDLFYKLRSNKLSKKPTTGELVDWFNIMLELGAKPTEAPKRNMVEQTLAALIKNQTDRDKAFDLLWPRNQGA